MYVASCYSCIHKRVLEEFKNFNCLSFFLPDATLGHHRPKGLHFRLPRLATKLDIKCKNLILWIGRLSVPDAVNQISRHGEDVNPL